MSDLNSSIAVSMRAAELGRRRARWQVILNNAELLREEQERGLLDEEQAALGVLRRQQAIEADIALRTAMYKWTFWARLRFLFTRRLP